MFTFWRHTDPDDRLPRRQIKLTNVSFWAHVKIAYRIVSRWINKQNSVSQPVDMANLLIPHCSVIISTVHLPNHAISLISLFIPLFSFFGVCSPIHYMCVILY